MTSAAVNLTVAPSPRSRTPSSIEADNDFNYDDNASTLYDFDDNASSASVRSAIYEYKYENGRRFHTFKGSGSWLVPNDLAEQDRLDLLHHIFRLLLDGALYCAPVRADIAHILDIGTGTGIWAMEMADDFPTAEVIGTDLSPVSCDWQPPNCKFMVEDAEEEWIFSTKFDFIHARGLCGAISNWPKFFGEVYEHLPPGGWVEMQDYDGWVDGDAATVTKAKNTQKWCQEIDRASSMVGKPFNIGYRYKEFLSEAGFVDIHEKVIRAPIGPWAKDKKLKEIGRFYKINMKESAESFTIGLFTTRLGYTLEEAQDMIHKVRAEFSDPSLHLWVNIRFVWARKPNVEEAGGG